MAPYTLVVLRHGESAWNASDRFAGWVDVPLTKAGRDQAVRAGALMAAADVAPDVWHTSLLARATTTADLAAEACGRHWAPVHRSWRLNERHYGTLQGRHKKEVLEEYGAERFMLWRRSDDTAPPRIDDDDEWSQSRDVRYAGIPDGALPRSESLSDVRARLLPYWYDAVVPDLREGKTVCIVAHGNAIRVLVKHLDDLSSGDTARLEVPTGVPVLYGLDPQMRPAVRGGQRLRARRTPTLRSARSGGRASRP